MATLLRHGANRIVIYSEDHRPSHVHVVGPEHGAVFLLNCDSDPLMHGPAELRENHGFRRKDLEPIAALIEAHLEKLCAEWRRVHGDH